MSQEQAKRLRSQDLFQMEKAGQDKTKNVESTQQIVDDLSPAVKKVIEEKLKTLKMKKQPIIMPISQEDFTVDVQPEITPQRKGSQIPTQFKGSSDQKVSTAKSKKVLQTTGAAIKKGACASKKGPMASKKGPLASKKGPFASKKGPFANRKGPSAGPGQRKSAMQQFQDPSLVPQYQGYQMATQFQGYPMPSQYQGHVDGAQIYVKAPYFKYPSGIPRSFLSSAGMTTSYQPQSNPPSTSQSQVPEASTSQMYAPNTVSYQANPSTGIYSLTDDAEQPDGSESPDEILEPGQKRLSAFKRLGPLSQPKKPKLTINLMMNKEDAVREVVDDNTKGEATTHIPVHLRKEILESKDETVVTYLDIWPWKKSYVVRTASASTSKKSQHYMLEYYEKDQDFIQVFVKGYPRTWTKEDVLDTIIDALKGRSFIPCFIEFSQDSCKFLVIRCRSALLYIHNSNYCIRKGEVELIISVSSVHLNLRTLNFVPRLILMKRLLTGYDGEKRISLKEFTLQSDVSHFIYFPLHFVANQTELVQLQSAVAWERVTDLDLSHNKLTSIDGFDLLTLTPKLQHLDLSHNRIDGIQTLLKCRNLGLRSIKLEGNPMCNNYIDPGYYVRVLKAMFPALLEIDGTAIAFKGQIPSFHKYYCPDGAKPVVEKFLLVYFPLLEGYPEERVAMEDLYDSDAVLTITFRYKLRYSPGYRYCRNLFLRSRVLEEEEMESVVGASSIVKLLTKWPAVVHDPSTFTIDVMHQNDSSTIIRIGGILKLTSETLAEDEHLMTFTRIVVLRVINEVEYKIQNELLYWDEPTMECAHAAFRYTVTKPRSLKVKLESPPDDYLKEKLVQIFVKLTDLDKTNSERCLEQKNWNIKSALEYFVKLLKLDGLQTLNDD